MLKYSRVSGKRFRIKLQLRPDQSLSIHGETAKIWNIQGKKTIFGITIRRCNGLFTLLVFHLFECLFVCLFRLGEIGLRDCMSGKEAWQENFGLCSLELEVPTRSWHFPVFSVQRCSWKYVTTWLYLGDVNIFFSLKIELQRQIILVQNLECLALKPGVKSKWLIA